MAELQTASAICGIVRTTWQTIELVRDVLGARKDAQMLWHLTENAFQVVQLLRTAMKARQESPAANTKPLEDRTVLVIKDAIENCYQVLNELAQKCIHLGAKDPRGLASIKVTASFASNANAIRKFETRLTIAICLVQLAHGQLDAIDRADALGRINSLLEMLVSKGETPSAVEDKELPQLSGPIKAAHARADSAVGLGDEENGINLQRTLALSSGIVATPEILPEDTEDDESQSSTLEDIQKFKEHINTMFYDRGADISQRNGEESALHVAVKNNTLEIAKWLVERGADMEVSTPRTPLLYAVKHNKPAFVDLLVSAGANIHVLDEHNWSLIHCAVDRNCEDALRTLLQRVKSDGLNSDVDAPCEMDWTPLMHLAGLSDREENVRLARILFDHGANPNTSDGDGYTALWYAVQGRYSPERNLFIQELLKRGADDELVRKNAQKQMRRFPAFKKSSVVASFGD